MKHVFAAPVLIATAMGLSACDLPKSETRTEIEVADARLVLPTVSGNPAAVYFTLSFSGDGEATLSGVSVEGAEMAMFHDVETKDGMTRMIPLTPPTLSDGVSIKFAPGGKHVMAMKLADTVEAGSEVDVALKFEERDDFVFPVIAQAFGESE